MIKNVEVECFVEYGSFEEIFGGNKMRYFIDEYNEYWYLYDDICVILGIDHNTHSARDIFKKHVYDFDITTCNVTNYRNKWRELEESYKDFISSHGVRDLIKRNNERNNKLLQMVNNIEIADTVFANIEIADEWNQRASMLEKSIKNKNYEQTTYHARKLLNLQSSRDIMDKAGFIDKEKEELIDILRYEVYSYDPEYVEVTLAKRVKENEAESKTVPLSKSTCPEWLMDVVKNSK